LYDAKDSHYPVRHHSVKAYTKLPVTIEMQNTNISSHSSHTNDHHPSLSFITVHCQNRRLATVLSTIAAIGTAFTSFFGDTTTAKRSETNVLLA